MIVIQDSTIFDVANYFLADVWGWIAGGVAIGLYRAEHARRASSAGGAIGIYSDNLSSSRSSSPSRPPRSCSSSRG